MCATALRQPFGELPLDPGRLAFLRRLLSHEFPLAGGEQPCVFLRHPHGGLPFQALTVLLGLSGQSVAFGLLLLQLRGLGLLLRLVGVEQLLRD